MQGKLAIILPIWLLSLALLSPPALAQRRLLPTVKIPSSGDSVNDFVPAGWIIEQQIEGELTSNHNPDIVLALIEKQQSQDNEEPEERYRGLVILERVAPGKLRRLAVATTVLRDTLSVGVLGGPSPKPEIEISQGVLEINEHWGLRLGTD